MALLVLAAIIAASPVHAQTEPAALIIGTVEALPALDPAEAGDVFAWEMLTHLYTGLTRQVPGTLRYELALAASHTVSPDGLTHTFTIRPDAAFDDGTPITARTFADSINRALRGRGRVVVAPYIKAANVTGDGALSLTLTAPIPYLEQLVALPPYFPVEPGRSNGIYRVAASNADSITLDADPAWKGTPPATSTVRIRHFDRPADLREALKAHQVDVAWRGLPLEDAQNAATAKGIHLTMAAGLQTFYALVSQTEAPFSDPALRQAMLPLFDRPQIVKSGLLDTAVPLYALLPPELASARSAVYPEFNVEQAASLLDKAGYSKYRQVESELMTSRLLYGDLYFDAADTLVNTLVRNGPFSLSQQDSEPRTFAEQLERGTFPLILIGWTPIVPHPDAYLRPLLHSTGTLASSAHYANPNVDRLLDQAAQMPDPARQMALYEAAQAIAMQDVVAIPLWQNRQLLVAWDSVTGITIEPNFLLRYERLELRR
jgi:peptide/nickel transport system substrate-binding protein